MKLLRTIANLGYGSRKEVAALFQRERVTDADGNRLCADDVTSHENVRLDGAPLDPAHPFTLMLHKPVGYTCSTSDPGKIIYDLLPPRFRRRSPLLASVGRLDRDTSGLLIMTDEGKLLHRIVAPKTHLPKLYEATLARDLNGTEVDVFASGTLMLDSERTALRPATLEIVNARTARVTLTEGRYHQVRRMFAAVGNHVETLHRSRIGGLELGELPAGEWRKLGAQELVRLFA